FFSSRRRHTRCLSDWSSDVCSSDLAIELDPTLFEACYYYARYCFKAGDLEKALKRFKKAQAIRPEDYQSAALIGQVLRRLHRADEAQRADHLASDSINKHLELNPNEARAFNLGAIVLARLGEVERAREWNN